MEFDRITTSNWTIAFPNDWIEKVHEEGTLYFGSPDGEKGFYLSLWEMSDDETRTPEELIASFQQTEIQSFFENNEGWELLYCEVSSNQSPAVGHWERYNKSDLYRVSGKQLSKGNLVLRASFHDYYCEDIKTSQEYFSQIVDSLELREPL